jgi:tetratricopeptide (TPR) repeat protein
VLEKYAMPAAPKSRDDQERLYAEWLKKTGMQEHPNLYMAGNENLEHGTVARILPLIFRFGGLLGPERNRKSWNMARTASLLSRLGWPAVADNIYEEAMKIRPLNMAAAEEAVNHAIACFEACSTQELRILYINRLNDRCLTMLEQDAGYPTALYGKAYVKMKSGHQDEAVAILEKLLQKRQDKPIMNLYAMALGEAGDMAGSLREKERLWEKAVTAWRKRLTLYPQGPDTFKAYLRLGDLFTRLGYSLEARANYVLALNEPDIPPEIAKKAREKVRKLEIELWGGSFIPVKNKMPDSISPFVPPLGPETAVKNRGAGQPGGRIGMGPPGRGPGIGPAPHAAQGAPERGIMPGPPGKRPERP